MVQAALIIAALALSGCASAQEASAPTPGAAPGTGECVTPFDLLEEDLSSFSILLQAVEALDYRNLLDQPNAGLTVLAPTNTAFVNSLAALGISEDQLFGVLNSYNCAAQLCNAT